MTKKINRCPHCGYASDIGEPPTKFSISPRFTRMLNLLCSQGQLCHSSVVAAIHSSAEDIISRIEAAETEREYPKIGSWRPNRADFDYIVDGLCWLMSLDLIKPGADMNGGSYLCLLDSLTHNPISSRGKWHRCRAKKSGNPIIRAGCWKSECRICQEAAS